MAWRSESRTYTGTVSPVEEESSEESEDESKKYRRLSIDKEDEEEINPLDAHKEGYLLKQSRSYNKKWKRKYFKLRGRKLYYANDIKAVIFDEIELTDLCLAECSIKNVNHSFQLITPFRSLALCAETRREMEDWLGALSASSHKRYNEPEQSDCLSGCHHWYATSHARPTYCNVCRDALGGVTSHGLSCEVCKSKVHKRCAAKAINNCKWTTLASVGKDIIEETDGTITMPHQWLEGNLPVSAKCAVCDKTCGSVLRMQDWRCLWCRVTVHTQCRPNLPAACPLGVARVSIVPPTALHSIQDEAWDAVRPQATSPLLVFVNSKSGDNQGVKFLRRFKQLLNPAQVFDLISTGPRLGLKLFRHFDPFRILVCSGDGSVGWVLSEIDKLDMHKQCQVAVLPLGTGNDLARVLGWGSSCDDDTHLPQLLEKYEKASSKILDRWSIMTFERTIAMPKLSLTPGQPDGILHAQILQYEETLVSLLQNILQSDETSVIISSAKRLCETIKDLVAQVNESTLTQMDDQLNKKCDVLHSKLDLLVHTLTSDQRKDEDDASPQPVVKAGKEPGKEDTESEMSFEKHSQKSEKDLSNINFRKHRRTSVFVEKEKKNLMSRADSLKRAIKDLVEHTETAVDARNRGGLQPPVNISLIGDAFKMDNLKVFQQNVDGGSNSDLSSCASSQISVLPRLVNISPLPDAQGAKETTSIDDDGDIINLPVPPDFADSRRASQIQQNLTADVTEQILVETCMALTKEQQSESPEDIKNFEEDKDCTSILSAISNEEASIISEILDGGHPFDPERSKEDNDNEDTNERIGHIDSPETDNTIGNSDALPGESLLDDISCMLGNDYGFDNDSFDTTEEKEIERIKRGSIERVKRGSSGGNAATKTMKLVEQVAQCGFENPAFMSQHHKLLENRNDHDASIRYCSLAQFVEGSDDIGRRSFKRRPSVGNTASSNIAANKTTTNFTTNKIEAELHGIDNEHFLSSSPTATRRISYCSMLNPAESARITAAFNQEQDKKSASGATKTKQEKQEPTRKLPIINPLVRLPTWPNVGAGSGFIGKCLLANADTLCAAVSPLIDPDETLLEGFYERCVMNNYFGIGIDAKISLDFHHKREEHPEKCRSRAKNYMWYGVLGSKQLLQKTYKNLEQRVQLECDGQRIPLPHLQGIVILNIPSFMGGINFWGSTKDGDIFLAPSFDDKILEVVAVFGSVQMAASRLINLQHHRIAQCQSIQINILGDEGVPIQVDGEAWIQPPGIIRILHKNRMQMLCRNRVLENSLKTWEEKQRHSVSAQGAKHRASVPHDRARFSLTRQSMPGHTNTEKSFLGIHIEKVRQHSFSGPMTAEPSQPTSQPTTQRPMTVTFMDKPQFSSHEPCQLFNEEEHHLLLTFIECSTSLVKWIKILAITYELEVDLYKLATNSEKCLERIHPNGKILQGPSLRSEFTKLVHTVRTLYEESCNLLHDRGDKLKLREDLENKLSACLASMELEMKKCVMYDTAVFLEPVPDDHLEHKRKGLFWMKFRRSSLAHAFPPTQNAKTRDVASWGTQEVATWLETMQLSEYVDSFVRNDIRGRELLTLARRDLKDLGVTKIGHMKRIQQAIKDLNN